MDQDVDTNANTPWVQMNVRIFFFPVLIRNVDMFSTATRPAASASASDAVLRSGGYLGTDGQFTVTSTLSIF